MKKAIVTLAAMVALGAAASASETKDTIKQDSTQKIALADLPATVVDQQTKVAPVDPNNLPQIIKDVVAKDYPGSTIKSASFDEATKTYTLQILQKDAKDPIEVNYTDKGDKIEKKAEPAKPEKK